MKRTKLIEYTLIVIAAIFGYKFFESIYSLVVTTIVGFNANGLEISNIILQLILVSGGYFFLFVFLIRKGREIAFYLNGNNKEDEELPIKIGKKALLHLILAGICINIILGILPDFFNFLYESLKTRSYGEEKYFNSQFEKGMLASSFIRLIIAVVVLACSKELAKWLLKNDGKDELILEAELKEEKQNN